MCGCLLRILWTCFVYAVLCKLVVWCLLLFTRKAQSEKGVGCWWEGGKAKPPSRNKQQKKQVRERSKLEELF